MSLIDNNMTCNNPECPAIYERPPRLRACSGCKESCYCSRECQKAHWSAGHKSSCERLRALHSSIAVDPIAATFLTDCHSFLRYILSPSRLSTAKDRPIINGGIIDHRLIHIAVNAHCQLTSPERRASHLAIAFDYVPLASRPFNKFTVASISPLTHADIEDEEREHLSRWRAKEHHVLDEFAFNGVVVPLLGTIAAGQCMRSHAICFSVLEASLRECGSLPTGWAPLINKGNERAREIAEMCKQLAPKTIM